jgi:hypothetical protein
MAKYYNKIFNKKDLYKSWVDSDFESIISLEDDTPEKIAKEIEDSLTAEMKKEKENRRFEEIVREIILKIAESKDWEKWFEQINEKKAHYTFLMIEGEIQKSLFSLVSLEEDKLSRLAKLSERGDIDLVLNKLERQQKLEQENEARFNHLHAIGKHIEDALRGKIDSDLIQVYDPTRIEGSTIAEDVQNGQDIIVRIKNGDKLIDVFYVEVKSKWDFTEPAHMSTQQVRKAALHPNEYALCCVDLRKHKDEDLINLPTETILECTNVKMGIGGILSPMIEAILEADNRSDDEQIKISEYRSNIGASIFEKGDSLEDLLNTIETKIRQKLSMI